ncbi:MAG: type IX secretion system membrane protein PorP/SprF [Prevotella sp.]|nr:type IX secretion system membrane protein PorP/SprF [Prevotella sp.]MDD7045941.1 type IX secretion system membrane protein PorP/SprF [Prevotella sp.]MDY5545976.1 type IX secretion system membrane protein PorP/SprF [Prevotella sp.]
MVKRQVLVIWALLFLTLTEVRAQYDMSFSHYFDMEPYFNAAAVGQESKLNVTGMYAIEFAGFENNPQTAYVAADMPLYFLKNYHGMGVQLMNDKIGLFTHQRLSLQYAFKRKLFGGMLSIGVQAGFLSEDFDGTKVDVEDSGDPALTNSQLTGSGIDFAAGVYFSHRNWYAGLSAQHLNCPTIKLGETNELKIDGTYYLTGGYNIKLRNPFLTIKPSVLVRTDGVAYRADLTGRLVYKNDKRMLYCGLSYSPTNSVTALVGGSFHGVNVGYSYEMYTGAISPGNGSHELFVGYQTDINLVKKGRNKHKSVRIL